MVKNLTNGRPLKLLFFFALPMVLGNLFQQLYNMVDSMVVGKFVGEDALAAVGSSFPVVFLSIAVAAGLSMGCTVVISQLFGAGQIKEMKTTIYTALITLGVVGLFIMALGEIFSSPLLGLLGTNKDIFADSLTYLRIYFGGAIFLFLYNSLNGIYNALGDSQTPLKFLIVSALTNIVLDLLFVIRFHMGVAGVAWATLIAQGMCAVFSFFVLMRRMRKMENEPEFIGEKPGLFEMSAVKRIAKVGVPSMIQQSIVSVSMMFMQGLVNSYGKVFVAGYTAATKIDTLAMMPNMNFSNAMSSYTAQNIGAGKEKRVTQGYKACLLMVLIFSIIITSVIFLFGPHLLGALFECRLCRYCYGIRAEIYEDSFCILCADGLYVCRKWSAPWGWGYGGIYAEFHIKSGFKSRDCLPAGLFYRVKRHLVVNTYQVGNRIDLFIPAD